MLLLLPVLLDQIDEDEVQGSIRPKASVNVEVGVSGLM